MSDELTSSAKLALLAKQLRASTPGIDLLRSEPIAVVGIGCRIPGGDGPAGFWRTLEAGVDAITEVPADRWDVDAYFSLDPGAPGKMNTRWGSFLRDVAGFDAAFFGITPREATTMDPQQRLLLEVVWEALEDAGQDVERLAGSAAGVFIAAYNSDYARLQFAHHDRIDAYTGSGTAHSIASGRISYFLDLHGPSVTVDTACSASLTAVHLACQSLRSGESSLALAGGVSLILEPEPAISMSKWGMLAKDGRCKAFDSRADGFVRGEGAGVVVLKRLSDALAAGDRVRAVIRGTAVNQDGRSTVLTAPNGLAQQAVIRQALDNAKVQPSQITYVEAHGTGTRLGDPIEVEALAEVLGRAEAGRRPCALASVKTNIGHLEAAAGVAGLIKVVLALEHRVIPSHLHFRELNPHISFEGTRFYVPVETRRWDEVDGPRLAGVSSFGFGGTNAHVVLEEAPRLPQVAPDTLAPPLQLLPLSAQGPAALRALARRCSETLRTSGGEPQPGLADVCFGASMRRTHLDDRLAVVADDLGSLAEKLEAFAETGDPGGAALGQRSRRRPTRVVFVFSGQGPQWWAMGRQLAGQERAFREVLDRCDAEMRRHASWSLLDELGADERQSRLSQTEIAQPALFSLQLALVALWRAWGIEPHALVGHSVGEVAAAHVAGALSFEQAVRLVVARGRVMQKATGLGRMASVELTAIEADQCLEGRRDRLAVAAVNAPRSTVLSGDREALEGVLSELTGRGVPWRWLPVDYAFHSPQMQALGEELTGLLRGLECSSPAGTLVSTTTGGRVAGAELDAAYWGANLRGTVRFAQAVEVLLGEGADVFLELAPHPVLSAAVIATAEERRAKVAALASLRRGKDERATMLSALAELYVRGCPVRWEGLHPDGGAFFTLPSYPWQHERYWFQPGTSGDEHKAAAVRGASPTAHPLLGGRLRSALPHIQFEAAWSVANVPFLADHRVFGAVVVPGMAFVEVLLAAAASAWGAAGHALEDLHILQPLVLAPEESRLVQVVLGEPVEGVASAEILSLPSAESGGDWVRHASGQLRRAASLTRELPGPGQESGWRSRCELETDADALYAELRSAGVSFGPRFQTVERLWIGADEAVGLLRLGPEVEAEMPAFALHPALLDACLHPLAAVLGRTAERPLYLPVGLERVELGAPPGSEVWARAVVRRRLGARGEAITADVSAWNSAGEKVAQLEGLRLERASRDTLLTDARQLRREALYRVAWEETTATGAAASQVGGIWLVFADRGGVAARLASGLTATGTRCILVCEAPVFGSSGPDQYGVNPWSPADFRTLFRALEAEGSVPQGAVMCWGLDARPGAGIGTEELRTVEKRLCGSALHLIQAAAGSAASRPARVILVTRGAQSVGAAEAGGEPFGAPLWGLTRTVALEHPELRALAIDLDPAPYVGEDQALLAEVVRADGASAAPGASQVALRAGRRFEPRLTRIRAERVANPPRPDTAPVRLELRTPGVLDDLVLQPMTRRPPGPGEVEIRVLAAGINFRDVLKALGVYPGGPGPLGDECAGLVSAVGPGVTRFRPGDEVVALATGAFASFVLTPQERVAPKPTALGFAEAASVPGAFLTAEYALRHAARLNRGERILIHAAAGGVGLAAVEVARSLGAEVFATAGSPEKRDYLRALGVRHVMSSRSLEFVAAIEEATRGDGVDVVVNSLAGDFIPSSFSVLKRGGRFVELGRTGIWTEAQVAGLARGIEYHRVFFADTCDKQPRLVQEMLEDVCARLGDARLSLPPVRTFPVEAAVEAFRFMAQARHVGKLVLTMGELPRPGTNTVRADATYLVTGGLAGVGLETARALVARGARHLVLAARSAPAEAAREAVREMEREGAEVFVERVDVANDDQCSALLERFRSHQPPLRGVIHAAGVLDDGVLTEQDWSRWERVLAPKVFGAWNLHRGLAGLSLDFFVCVSSAASVLGSAGQGSYAAANAFLDALAHLRRARGLPGLSVNWGPWADVGMASRLTAHDRERLDRQGFQPITVAQGTSLLFDLIAAEHAQVVVLPVDWARYVAAFGPEGVPSLVASVAQASAAAVPGKGEQGAALARRLEQAPPARRRGVLVQALQDLAVKVMGLSAGSGVDPGKPLRELGLDSLMAVELRNALAAGLGRSLPATLLFDYPSLDAIADHVLGTLAGVASRSRPSVPEPTPDASDRRGVEELTETEAHAELMRELADLQGRRPRD